jgi:DNA polymerase
MDYLRAQVKRIEPKIIVCLGRIAAMRLIKPEFRITKEHGQWTHRNGIWMTAIYHPSALLRDLSKRPETFEDLLSIRQKIEEVHAKV